KVTTSQTLIPYPNLAAGDIIEVHFNSYKTPDSSGTPATNKITFGLAAINNTSGDITSVNEMIAAMNTVGFTITAGYISILEVQVYRNINGEKWRVFLRYHFKNNNITGTWGTGSTNGE